MTTNPQAPPPVQALESVPSEPRPSGFLEVALRKIGRVRHEGLTPVEDMIVDALELLCWHVRDHAEPTPEVAEPRGGPPADGDPATWGYVNLCELCGWAGHEGSCPNCNGDRGLKLFERASAEGPWKVLVRQRDARISELEALVAELRKTLTERESEAVQFAEERDEARKVVAIIGDELHLPPERHNAEHFRAAVRDQDQEQGPAGLRSQLSAAQAESAKWLTECQQLYDTFRPENSPKNPREAKQAIENWRADNTERGVRLAAVTRELSAAQDRLAALEGERAAMRGVLVAAEHLRGELINHPTSDGLLDAIAGYDRARKARIDALPKPAPAPAVEPESHGMVLTADTYIAANPATGDRARIVATVPVWEQAAAPSLRPPFDKWVLDVTHHELHELPKRLHGYLHTAFAQGVSVADAREFHAAQKLRDREAAAPSPVTPTPLTTQTPAERRPNTRRLPCQDGCCSEVCDGGYKAYDSGSVYGSKWVLPCKTCHPDWWEEFGAGTGMNVTWWPEKVEPEAAAPSLLDGLRQVAAEATPEQHRRVEDNPSGFIRPEAAAPEQPDPGFAGPCERGPTNGSQRPCFAATTVASGAPPMQPMCGPCSKLWLSMRTPTAGDGVDVKRALEMAKSLREHADLQGDRGIVAAVNVRLELGRIIRALGGQVAERAGWRATTGKAGHRE